MALSDTSHPLQNIAATENHVRLRVRGGDGDKYEVLADQFWADEAGVHPAA
jgi:hypothetical protein